MSNVKKYKTFLLSKKRWHVGLPENVAKVKKDEEEFRIKEEEDKRQKIFKASEQRMEILKKRNDGEENSDLPIFSDASSSDNSLANSSESRSSSSKTQVQQETFKNVQNIPWYCKIEKGDGNNIVAREMRISYHGVLLESKQPVIPISDKPIQKVHSSFTSLNPKIPPSFGEIIDGSEYLSSFSQSDKQNNGLQRQEKEMILKNRVIKEIDSIHENVILKNTVGEEKLLNVLGEVGHKENNKGMFLKKKEEEEEFADQNIASPPPILHKRRHKKRKKDESNIDSGDSDSSSSESSSSSSSSSDSSSSNSNREKKKKRKREKEKKKRKKEKKKGRKKK